MKNLYRFPAVALSSGVALGAFAQSGAPGNTTANDQTSAEAVRVDEIIITSRRREELAQEVPIPVTVVSGDVVADSGGFNVNRLKELIPSVQLYSSNPRNTAIGIRGQGTTFAADQLSRTHSVDVAGIKEIDIVVTKRGDRLIVEINQKDLDNVELHWRIEMPGVRRTTGNLGVGQIIAEVQNTELRVDLGVGEASVALLGN